MVTTRSRSQGSPQVRDPETVGNGRKRLQSEQASPLHVQKRSKRLDSHETGKRPSRNKSEHIEPKSKPAKGTSSSTEVNTGDKDEPNSVHLALRQRPSAAQPPALNEPSSVLPSEPRWSNHVRFGSEDGITVDAPQNVIKSPTPEQAAGEDPILQRASEASDGDGDDDEAPEAISTSTSQAQARNLAVEATKAIRSQQKHKKELRKEKDSMLKRQAQESSSRRPHGSGLEAVEHDDPSRLARQLLKESRMPEYLPPAILEVEPESMLQSEQQQQKNKKVATTFPVRSSRNKVKRPKEMMRQGRIVKILESNESLQLSPILASSKPVRESWLTGRRKNDDSVVSRRQSFSKGFLRR